MAEDIEFNKNEDQNNQNLADLNSRPKKVHVLPVLALLFCTTAIAQSSRLDPPIPQPLVFPQANGSTVEVMINERALINTPEPYSCAQDWASLMVLLRIDREGNVKGSQLLLSSNFSLPACTAEMRAHAEKLRFTPDPNARKTEWVFVTYRAPAKE